jgi:hypothetical protein
VEVEHLLLEVEVKIGPEDLWVAGVQVHPMVYRAVQSFMLLEETVDQAGLAELLLPRMKQAILVMVEMEELIVLEVMVQKGLWL